MYTISVMGLPGNISAVLGSRHFEVKLNDDRIVKRHLDQVRIRTNDVVEETLDYRPVDVQPRVDNKEHLPAEPLNTPPEPQVRHSTRNRRPPNRYDPVSS